MVDAGGDASGFAWACVVIGACVTVGVIPAILGEQVVPVGEGVVAAAGEVGVVEEVVVVSWFGSVDLWVDGEEMWLNVPVLSGRAVNVSSLSVMIAMKSFWLVPVMTMTGFPLPLNTKPNRFTR